MGNYVTMRHMNNMGRFGNQIFEYMFLRTYARRYNLELQVAEWVGSYLYGFNDPPVTVTLPKKKEYWSNPKDAMCQKFPPRGDEYVNTDWVGYGQFHTSYYAPDREFIQAMFEPLSMHVLRMEHALARLRNEGDTIVALHVRRGDYGRKLYHCTPAEWYKTWLREHWGEFSRPVLFLATEDRDIKDEFSEWNPLLVEDLDIVLNTEPYPYYNYLPLDLERRDPWQMDWFPEYYLLNKADVVVAANSTYSFTAAMLNPHLQQFWRSTLRTFGFERLDVWNCEPLDLEQSEDYSHIPGVRLPDNPYWR